MIIFVIGSQRNKGAHRYFEGFTVHDKCKLVFINRVEESNEFFDDYAIFVGFLPEQLKINTTIPNKYYGYCSSLLQADLSSPHLYSAEIGILMQVKEMMNYGFITQCIVSDFELAELFDFWYFPAVEMFDYGDLRFKMPKERHGFGFLGNNFRKHRNFVTQIAAMSQISPKENIIVSQYPGMPVNLYKNYELLFNCTILPKEVNSEELFEEISSHRLGFICSIAETFSYQALDYAFCGVPCIVSAAIEWYPVPSCQCENTDSPKSIWRAAQTLLNNTQEYVDLSTFLKEWAMTFNEENKERLFETIQQKFFVRK